MSRRRLRSINKCNCWWQREKEWEREIARKNLKLASCQTRVQVTRHNSEKSSKTKRKTWRRMGSGYDVAAIEVNLDCRRLALCVRAGEWVSVSVCAILVSSLVAAGAPPSCASLLHSILCMPLPQTVAYFRALDCAWVTASQVELAPHPLLYPTFSLASLLCTEKLPSPSCVANQA